FALVGALALGVEAPMAGLFGAGSVLAIVAEFALGLLLAGRRAAFGKGLVEDTRRVLWSDASAPALLAISSAVVVLLSLTFYCAARATAVDLDFVSSMYIAPLVLGSMAIPLAIAGWGIRE